MDGTDRWDGRARRGGRGLFRRRPTPPGRTAPGREKAPGRPTDDEVLHQYLEGQARAAEAEAAELRNHLASMRERLRERDRAVAALQGQVREARDDVARRQAELDQLIAQLRLLEETAPMADDGGAVDAPGDASPSLTDDGVRVIPVRVPVELLAPTSDT